jgi:hypothetical protein
MLCSNATRVAGPQCPPFLYSAAWPVRSQAWLVSPPLQQVHLHAGTEYSVELAEAKKTSKMISERLEMFPDTGPAFPRTEEMPLDELTAKLAALKGTPMQERAKKYLKQLGALDDKGRKEWMEKMRRGALGMLFAWAFPKRLHTKGDRDSAGIQLYVNSTNHVRPTSSACMTADRQSS